MNLNDIYKPIEHNMPQFEQFLSSTLERSSNISIKRLNQYLLASPGKRIRPALVMLSARAEGHNRPSFSIAEQNPQIINIAAAVELMHMASLVHDDVIDHSPYRYNKQTINDLHGADTALALGDYLYSEAFSLIANCGNMQVIQCLSDATRAMCEGQLIQVCERENFDLLKERYITVVKKKTGSLFAASCHAGTILSCCRDTVRRALMDYGMNFGVAFQIIDDHLDITGEMSKLGKNPGQDLHVGEITLPVLNLLESVSSEKREELKILLDPKNNGELLKRIKSEISHTTATRKTRETALYYINAARDNIRFLEDSPYKHSLLGLTDFIMDRGFNGSNKIH